MIAYAIARVTGSAIQMYTSVPVILVGIYSTIAAKIKPLSVLHSRTRSISLHLRPSTTKFRVNASQALLKTDLIFEIYPLTAWENPPTIYILFNHIPSQTEYYLASPFPLQQNQEFTIPYTALQSGVWYIAVQSNYNDYQKLQLEYNYVADCTFCKHGKCDQSKAATCSCDSGWQGVGCDVATDSGSSDSGTSVGVAVALVFVFLFVGIAVGILIKREFPSVCGNKGTSNSAHYEDESDPVTGTNELPAARTSYT